MIVVKSIRMESNGYILTLPKQQPEGTEPIVVFEYEDDEKSECEAINKMFWEILEIIRPNSKHNKYNIEIRVKENL